MRSNISIIFFTAFLMAFTYTQTTKYPMILWSETAFNNSTESSGAMHAEDVLKIIKKTVDESKPKNVLFLIKDGFSTGDLVKNAKKFENLKEMVGMHASMFSNLRQPFDINMIK